MNENYSKLEKIFEDIGHLNSISELTQWYYRTYMPPGASSSRQIDASVLYETINKMKSSDIVEKLINKASDEYKNLDSWQKSNFNIIKKEFTDSNIVPVNLDIEYNQASAECEFIWRKARADNNFKILKPHLDKVFQLSREIANIKSEYFGMSPYNYLVDKFDPDNKIEDIKPILDKTKKFLAKFIPQIMDKQSSNEIIPIKDKISIDTQRQIGTKIMEKMGFDLSKGRLDQAEHPFSIGNRDDVRLTTTYFENNFLISTYSIIHELGHGLYTQNLPEKYKYQPVGQFKGHAFHESQALIMEKQIGTSRSFVEFYSKILRDEFGFIGKEYSAQNLFNILNQVKPSFIRIDADELTYPLHIILRTEIEEQIINNKITADDLPDIWNQKMEEYLGIIPKNFSQGCLQDIHWPSGLIGYFPSYYLGSIIASMKLNKMKNLNHNIESQISSGDFTKINEYLNNNFRNLGCSLSSNELLTSSTGYEKLDLDTHLRYFQQKYLNL